MGNANKRNKLKLTQKQKAVKSFKLWFQLLKWIP